MGQKANPIVFRLGYKNNIWDSNYLESNLLNTNIYTFQHIEIKKFIFQIFKQHHLTVTYVKILRSKNNISLIICFIINVEIKNFIFKQLKNWKLKFKSIKKKRVKKNYYKRIWIIKIIKNRFYFKKFKTLKKNIMFKITSILKKYLNNYLNIFVILHNISKSFSLNMTLMQKEKINLIKLYLRKYNKVKFYKNCFNILIVLFKKKLSVITFANFICYQLEVLKKHKFFFNFLKRILLSFLMLKFSQIKGIKIHIKGRLNGKPRSDNYILVIGKLALQTKNAKICYNESVAYSLYGTFGLKIWINYSKSI